MKKVLHIGLCVNPNGFSSFPHAFKQVLGEENYRELPTGDPHLNQNAIELFNQFKPDIVFMQIQAENIIHANVCKYFLAAGATVINWSGDKRDVVPQWMIDLAPHVSLTSFSNMEDVRKMRSLGFKSEYLEIGYDPEIYKPEGEAYSMPEIVFFGNHYGDNHFPMSKFRREMVEFLQKEYGNRFGVYGSGWVNGNGNFNHSQHQEAAAYRGAKIAINVSHFDCERYNSDRLLRISGTGVACLSFNHIGTKEIFQEGLGYFETFDELKNNLDFLLSMPNFGKSMSLLANEFVKENFTFEHMVKNILKLAE